MKACEFIFYKNQSDGKEKFLRDALLCEIILWVIQRPNIHFSPHLHSTNLQDEF